MPVLTVSQFHIPASEARTCEPLLGDFPDAAKAAPGFISTSVWKSIQNPEKYLRLTVFDTVDNMDTFYDQILKSDRLVETISKFGIVPDVIQFDVNHVLGFDPAKVHSSEFMSFSLRAMDPGYDSDWVEKLTDNFREVSLIGGFEGAMVATEEGAASRVAGMAFWQTQDAFNRSVPDNPDYEIQLFKLYR